MIRQFALLPRWKKPINSNYAFILGGCQMLPKKAERNTGWYSGVLLCGIGMGLGNEYAIIPIWEIASVPQQLQVQKGGQRS